MDPVPELWTRANFRVKFEPPTILYAYNRTGEKLLVISDHGTIYRLMNQQGHVFMIAHFRCRKDGDRYICEDPMHIVSCTKYSQDEDQYAYSVILPRVNFKQ